jgi:hypothetical protein
VVFCEILWHIIAGKDSLQDYDLPAGCVLRSKYGTVRRLKYGVLMAIFERDRMINDVYTVLQSKYGDTPYFDRGTVIPYFNRGTVT